VGHTVLDFSSITPKNANITYITHLYHIVPTCFGLSYTSSGRSNVFATQKHLLLHSYYLWHSAPQIIAAELWSSSWRWHEIHRNVWVKMWYRCLINEKCLFNWCDWRDVCNIHEISSFVSCFWNQTANRVAKALGSYFAHRGSEQGRIKLFGAPRQWKNFRPLFQAVFLSGGGGITPRLSQTPRLSVPRQK